MADTPDLGKLWKQLTDNIGGGMTGALDKLKKSNIGEQVQSWIGKGENKPVTPEQVTQALGNEQLAKIADQTGVTSEQAAQNLAKKLPSMVDKITPDGQLPDQSVLAGAPGGASKTGMNDRRPPV